MAAEQLTLSDKLLNEASDIGLVIAIIGILMSMLLPLPPFMLDLLLALNITLAVIVLITAMYTEKPLDFSIFPALLLMLTLFRLSLNVASTRLILLKGNEGVQAAGSIIQSFGNFVVGGNYVIGFIIFIILVLINFIVITKGSGRIAEVAARFTLDAMPGKQMAIDADLNAGIIDEGQAKARREEIAKEAEFHGAMDGASKFVRGDAIAGIIITLINIIGGFIIGVFQMNMELLDAAQSYSLLTIGDGLVSQIPALIISTGAGILVSRSGSDKRMGKAFSGHVMKNPQPVFIGAFVSFLMGLVPGLPFMPFATLAFLIAGGTFLVLRKQATSDDLLLPGGAEQEEEDAEGPEEVEHLLTIDLMELEVGYGLIPLVDKDQDGNLLDRIRAIRRQFATELGIIVPPIHIRDNLKLKPSEYRFLIRGGEMAKGELIANHLLAMNPGDVTAQIEGIETTEPAFNLPAIWIPPEKEEEAKFAGYTVVDNSTVIATHLTELIRNNVFELLGRQETQHLLDNLAKTNPKAVEELVPANLSLGTVQKILQNLLRERVSIRDLLTIVETLADYAPMSKDPDLLTEYVRQKLARSILSHYVQDDSILPLITLEPSLEEALMKNIRTSGQTSYLSIDPGFAESLIQALMKETEKVMGMNLQPIILCASALRRHFKKLVEQYAPTVMVISHAEIIQNIRIQSVGKVDLTNES